LVESLEESAAHESGDQAYELALCMAMGLGTKMKAAEAREIALHRSNKTMFELDQDIGRLRHERITLSFQQ
jgi:hypothetical protein